MVGCSIAPALESLLQIALLARAQCGAADNEFRLVGPDTLREFVYLALADEIPGIRSFPRADNLVDDERTGRACELRELLTFRVVRCAIGARVDENCSFATLRSFKQ